MFVHTVYFWLHDTAAVSAGEQIIADCRELLTRIPGVVHLWAGKAVPSTRAVVDGSFAAGLTVVFADAAAHEVYQTHELHLQFIARNKASWSRVQVYDFE